MDVSVSVSTPAIGLTSLLGAWQLIYGQDYRRQEIGVTMVISAMLCATAVTLLQK